ncbi:hypothetical protein R6Q57_024941 [Mikania cordata]
MEAIVVAFEITMLNNLDASIDDYIIKVRILRKWRHPDRKYPNEDYSIEMILIDEELFCMEEGDSHCYDPTKKHRLNAMDLISDLPDTIIHRIMSFLTSLEVTTLSILSKRFFNLWASFPVIQFDHETYSRRCYGMPAYETDGFLDHVHNSILLRRISTDLSEFRVRANLIGISTDLRFDFAISIVHSQMGLGLQGLQLDLCKVIQVCPSLRTVSLKSCANLEDIDFSSKALTEIEFYSCSVDYIKINAPNLHLFHFQASKKDPEPCHIDVLQCQNIMYLSLNNVVNGGDWIAEHVSALNKLKTFILKGCQDIDHITVRNEKLKNVVICHCSVLTSIEVKATSLESFLFEELIKVGFTMIKVRFPTLLS